MQLLVEGGDHRIRRLQRAADGKIVRGFHYRFPPRAPVSGEPSGTQNRLGRRGTPDRLPQMEADVILESPSRRIILDAKYRNALGGRFGGKLHSHNLYQLLTYLRNREATALPGAKHEGILLYPTVDAPMAVDVCLEGYSIPAASILLRAGAASIGICCS